MTQTFHARLTHDGRVVIPAPLRHRLGLKPGDPIVIDADEDSVRLRSYAQVVKDVQDYFRQFAPPGVSIVNELLAERRAEAAREEAELAESRKTHGQGDRE
jgi:AbrB family looped-hinge helix DNA binding protein